MNNIHRIGNSIIALIERHDGRLSRPVLACNGLIEIEFESVSAYEQTGADRYEIWAYCATLVLADVVHVLAHGLIDGKVRG